MFSRLKKFVSDTFDRDKRMSEDIFEIGQKHFKNQNFEDAIMMFRNAIQFNDKNWMAYNNRGNAKSILSDRSHELEEKVRLLEEAVGDFEKSIEINPDTTENRKAYLNLRRDTEALQKLDDKLVEKRARDKKLRSQRVQGVYVEETDSELPYLLRFFENEIVMIASAKSLVPHSRSTDEASVEDLLDSRFGVPDDKIGEIASLYKREGFSSYAELPYNNKRLRKLATALLRPEVEKIPRAELSREGKRVSFHLPSLVRVERTGMITRLKHTSMFKNSVRGDFGSGESLEHMGDLLFRGSISNESEMSFRYGSEGDFGSESLWKNAQDYISGPHPDPEVDIKESVFRRV